MHTYWIGGAEMESWDGLLWHKIFHFVDKFCTSYLGSDNLVTDLDSVGVKTLLSISLTCSLMPCLCVCISLTFCTIPLGDKEQKPLWLALCSHVLWWLRESAPLFFLPHCHLVASSFLGGGVSGGSSHGWMGKKNRVYLHSFIIFSLGVL